MYFLNVYEEMVFVQEIFDPEFEKHYIIETRSHIINKGFLMGMLSNEVYITDKDPTHDVWVCIARKAFFPDEVHSIEDLTDKMQPIIEALLPDGCLRFERALIGGIEAIEEWDLTD